VSTPLARVRVIALWVITVIASLGIELAGITKLPVPNHWQHQFLTWGYPSWFVFVVGAAEVVGGAALLVPRFALPSVGLLLVIMSGALATLVTHPRGSLGSGVTPAFYIGMLSVIGVMRWRRSAAARIQDSSAPTHATVT
jgi:uncharacterized membrane protein YphA (DoxX/SURF4 family)